MAMSIMLSWWTLGGRNILGIISRRGLLWLGVRAYRVLVAAFKCNAHSILRKGQTACGVLWKGLFLVRTEGFWILDFGQSPLFPSEEIWGSKVPSKVIFFR